jgi:D-glycero-alpha-D-manno-heptose-7-phosphate kinase
MIITATPYRISFFGGGTDYPAWFQEHGGAVLATTINRYSYLSCRFLPPFFENKHRVVWSRIELVNEINEICHPMVREAIRFLDIENGLEIHLSGDLPARSGIGSSSAFTVGMLNALYALKGQLVSRNELAKQAIYLEQDVIKENVGIQDQITTAYGGLNVVEISHDGSFLVNPLPLGAERRQELQDHLLMIYTGVVRTASEIAEDTIKLLSSNKVDLHILRTMVKEGAQSLINGNDVTDFGRLLHESWLVKRGISNRISSPLIDEIYEKARKAGAIGGKVLGAGGGGFILFFVRPEDRCRLLSALDDFLVVPVEFETFGTRIIFCQTELYSHSSLRQRDFIR